MNIHQKFYSGTSGLVLPIPKRLFPAEFQNNTRLHYYSTMFNSIEINSSFYKVPGGATLSKWSTEVSNDFKFTFKLWKGITHNKMLEFNSGDVDHFIKTIDNVGDKRGCLLIQFPPSTTISSLSQLKKLLKCICKADTQPVWSTAVEFRNNSWHTQEVFDLLNKLKIGLVVHDHPTSITPFIDIETSFRYLRFHGIKGDYRGTYSDDILHAYVTRVQEWLKENKTVYTYFNNTIGEAVNNLTTMNGMVGN